MLKKIVASRHEKEIYHSLGKLALDTPIKF